MENLFNLFQDNLKSRYSTLLKNLKYKSNSFYDAYNSLMEEYLKEVLKKELGIEKINGSIHDILSKPELRDYFLNTLNISNTSLKKLLDYAHKINQHKHKIEHDLTLENALNYFKLMYVFLYAYTSYKGLSIPNYNEDFIKELYGSGLKESNLYEHIVDMEAKLDSIYENAGISDLEAKREAERKNAKIIAKVNDLKAHGKRLFNYSEPTEDIRWYKIKLGICLGLFTAFLTSFFIIAFVYLHKAALGFVIVGFIFLAYYLITSYNFFSFKENISLKELKGPQLISFVKLSDGKTVPFKDKTILSFFVALGFAFYLLLFAGFFMVRNEQNEVINNVLTFIFIVDAILPFVYRRIGYNFLEKYENIYLYDDEAEVTFWPSANQFLDFRFKK